MTSMTTFTDTVLALVTAREHQNEGEIPATARECAEDAQRALELGELDDSYRWSVRSLAHSVGQFSPIYRAVLARFGHVGEFTNV